MSENIDVRQFESRLLRLREEILSLQEERNASSAAVELDQSRTGRLSRMDAMQQQAMAQDVQRRAGLALRRIDAALRRCEDGSYGKCLECGEVINPRRLELDPAATLCITCAQACDG